MRVGRAALQGECPAEAQDRRRGTASRWHVIEQVILLGLDDASMVGRRRPSGSWSAALTDLRKPDAILIDYNRLHKLFPGEAGTRPPRLPA